LTLNALHPLKSRLARGAWIETLKGDIAGSATGRVSQGARGLKLHDRGNQRILKSRVSQGARGLKLSFAPSSAFAKGRVSQGARGLKLFQAWVNNYGYWVASRKGRVD